MGNPHRNIKYEFHKAFVTKYTMTDQVNVGNKQWLV